MPVRCSVLVAAFAAPLTAQLDWTLLAPGSAPAPRSLIEVVDAGPMGLLLFGGELSSYYANDTWRWANDTWTPVTTTNAPPPRGGCGICYDPVRDRVVCFGGWSNGYLADTWEFDGSSWTNVTPAVSPSGRDWPGMAFDPVSQRVILFGGHDWTQPPFGDTWAWDGATWTQLAPTAAPSGRYAAVMAPFDASGIVMLHGGAGATLQPSGPLVIEDDTWLWIGSDWVQVSASSPMPPRYQAQHAYDPVRERFVVMGGEDETTVFGDVWEYAGGMWTQRVPLSAGPAVHDGAAFFDPQRGQVLLFGGSTTLTWRTNINNDTWALGPSVPAIARSFGVGCGNAPTLGHAHLAWLGGTYGLESSGSPANAVVVFLAGLSRTLAAGSTPLPLPLDGFGMPGCSLFVDPAATSVAIADAGGAASLQLVVPAAPPLLGLWLYGQVAQLSPGVNPAGVVLSNAVEHRLGGL